MDLSAALCNAGLPACFWPFACWQYCLVDNIRPPTDDKLSPYALTNGEEWIGPLIPFGVGVILKAFINEIPEIKTKWKAPRLLAFLPVMSWTRDMSGKVP